MIILKKYSIKKKKQKYRLQQVRHDPDMVIIACKQYILCGLAILIDSDIPIIMLYSLLISRAAQSYIARPPPPSLRRLLAVIVIYIRVHGDNFARHITRFILSAPVSVTWMKLLLRERNSEIVSAYRYTGNTPRSTRLAEYDEQKKKKPRSPETGAQYIIIVYAIKRIGIVICRVYVIIRIYIYRRFSTKPNRKKRTLVARNSTTPSSTKGFFRVDGKKKRP